MAKYRIKVESLDPAEEELRAEYRMGIECEAFCIIADMDDGTSFSMHDMSRADLAMAIANCPEAMVAAIMAKGIIESREYARKNSTNRLAKMLMGKLGGAEGDEV